MATGAYYKLPSGRGVWWQEADETPSQALCRISDSAGLMWTQEIKDELKALFPDDPFADRVPVIEN